MPSEEIPSQPGLIVLFGSGETSPTGRKIFEEVLRTLPRSPKLALLETPAGFELNSHQVISRVGEFFSQRLQNYTPQVEVIPARKRETAFSPDDPQIVSPLLNADLIFMGPGSPSYTIRQLRDSLAWYYLLARHRLGAVLALASAATVAFSARALPVYEIYKVGEELHWIDGLDFFQLYGLQLVLIPHWNNHEGGAELDTSRCFMGQERFRRLLDMLPAGMTVIGLDEKTALVMDPSKRECQVSGLGSVTLFHTSHHHEGKSAIHALGEIKEHTIDGNAELDTLTQQHASHVHQYPAGQVFSMSEIGHFHPCQPEAILPPGIWQEALRVASCKELDLTGQPPKEVLQIIQEREIARRSAAWWKADTLRKRAAMLGWEIIDTKDGPVSKKLLKM